jgi:2,4-dienoyl-CoA reductase-like NADH-dependent reductase (Old Yellow Enzyme family)
MSADPIFQPLTIGAIEIKNRLVRSSVGGRFDHYDGTGSQARINWEEKFARGGVGLIVANHIPVSTRGRVVPNSAHIETDDTIPFWRRLGDAVHRHECKYFMQLTHAGRQRDIPGIENRENLPLSPSGGVEPLNGIVSAAMTHEDIADTVRRFADQSRRTREAGLDGVEIHGAQGYLFTQFLSPAINERTDEYGGSLENRARLLLDTVRAIRAAVGADFPLGVKISAVDYNDAVYPWLPAGTTLPDTLRVCRWLEEAGVDYIHVSVGSFFPHPLNPPGGMPIDVLGHTYGSMLRVGKRALMNYASFRSPLLGKVFLAMWSRVQSGRPIEGINIDNARAVKQQSRVPVFVTGGFQTASVIRRVLSDGTCDAVSIARPLVANPDLPQRFARGEDRAPRPCTYCNRCLYNFVENPTGCYDLTRFDGDYDRMIREVMTVFQPGDSADDLRARLSS